MGVEAIIVARMLIELATKTVSDFKAQREGQEPTNEELKQLKETRHALDAFAESLAN